MSLRFASLIALNPSLIRASILHFDGLGGAKQPMPVFHRPMPRLSDDCTRWGRIVTKLLAASFALCGVFGLHGGSHAQSVPIVSVERDGDSFHVTARASVAVDPRIAWDTITDYEHMREFLPNIERSRVISRSGARLVVEHVGQFPLFLFDVPVRVRLAVTQQPYERVVARSEAGEIDGEPQTLRSFSGSYDLAVITIERRAGVRLLYESHFEMAEPLPPIVGDLFGTAMVTKTVRRQFEAMLREMSRRQAARATIEKPQ